MAHRSVSAIPSRRAVDQLDRYDQVLLDTRHPGADPGVGLMRTLQRRLSRSSQRFVQFAENDVWQFERRSREQS